MGTLPPTWRTNLDDYLSNIVRFLPLTSELLNQVLFQTLYSVPQQYNFTDCGVYVIAFSKLLCLGGDPTNPLLDLPPTCIQQFRNHIVVRLAQEYITQQAIAKKILDPAMLHTPQQADAPRPAPKRLPAPFPLPINLSHKPVPVASQKADTPLLELEYCPAINSWGLWPMTNGLYYPARVLAMDIHTKTATLEWLDHSNLQLPDLLFLDTTFLASISLCYEAIDDAMLNTLSPDLVCQLFSANNLLRIICIYSWHLYLGHGLSTLVPLKINKTRWIKL